MPSGVSFIDAALLALFVYLLGRLIARSSPTRLPPGPRGLPLIGNLLDLPKDHEWETFTRWGRDFGDLSMVRALGTNMLVINSSKIAVDMLEKKSNIYSDRPWMKMACDLVGHKGHCIFSPYNDRLRLFRKMFHGVLAGKENLDAHTAIEEHETHRFLYRLSRNPDGLREELRRLAGAIILKVCHGYELVEEGDDPMVDLVERVMIEFGDVTTPGHYVVDIIPWLAYLPGWLPGMGFKRAAVEMRKVLYDGKDMPIAFVKEQMAKGTAMRCFTSKCLEKVAEGNAPYNEDMVGWAGVNIYGGEANYSFFLAMMLHPDVQKKAQEEIDRVVGPDRLPTLADREHLPYINALVKETMRWQVVLPQALPHVLREDDIHEGFFIPKGTICIPNVWGFLHDPATYRDPENFNPSRFLEAEGKPAETDSRLFCFGFGRRICPGRQLADASIFLQCAMSLAVFNIDKPLDNSGTAIEPVLDRTSGVVTHPTHFACTIKPRSARAAGLIRSFEDAL
ncbi:cytochrome P450 [Punctularia strigosozonata HHB-11173 SS5]|uniref:cytochrome P450 n=1 Tax=Punctularia strigosozonata (strain HHB-11173) TaxID=741275 RepID=UPI0004418739|nr:cytochrome P450 [Punctularia strigosozonata HHB-11173 SS5]EIN06103.1 cytochrome P450 [Punctularia strigosozonata HHB-11173 SS5]